MKIIELKSTTTKIKNSQDRLNGRLKITKDGITGLEDCSIKFTQSEKQLREIREKEGPVGQ